jgi:hypothetical protein
VIVSPENRQLLTQETALTGTRQKWRGSLSVFLGWGLAVPLERHVLGARAFFYVRGPGIV